MEIAAAMTLFDAAITLIEKIKPRIEEWAKKGLISVEDQKKCNDRYNALRASGFAFTRPPQNTSNG